MKKFFNFFLAGYNNHSLEIQKKSKLLLIFLFCAYITGISIIIVSIITGRKIEELWPFFFGIIFGIIILIFLKFRLYSVASYLFIAMFIFTSCIVVISDPYDHPFEIYRFMFSMMFALITSCLVSYNRIQIILVIIIGNILLSLLFLYKYYLPGMKITDNTALITFINCLILFTFSGIFAYLIMLVTKQIIKVAEDNADEARKERDESNKRLRIIEVYTKHSLVEKIEKGIDPTKYAPESKKLAILFCDIRDFTRISEDMNPIDIVKLLNIYFEEMNKVISANNGEIDKLIGDSIMAAFDTPDDAVKASIQMKKALITFNSSQKIINKKLENGIGIHYGKIVAGNIGSSAKKDNTIIGDIVNASSRLEGLTRIYNVDIIISDELLNNLKENYNIQLLDEVLVKGKTHPQKLYTIYDHFDKEKINKILHNKPLLDKAFKLYSSGDFIEAVKIYNELIETNNCNKKLLNFYILRCKKLLDYKKEGKLTDWKGIYSFQHK